MPKKSATKKEDSLHIGQEIEALEQLLTAIEDNDGDIDASIETLTTAMEKAKVIRTYLKKAELQVAELIDGYQEK
jgi:exonuclease VII small subunit